MSLYIGLISGTSMDGVDAALVSIDDNGISVVGWSTSPYPIELREQLTQLIKPNARISLHEFATVDIEVGRQFADAAQKLLDENETSGTAVVAIGSHGQTLRHSPDSELPYSVQIGDAATIATRCSITTVADFRSLDLAAGGQGAPLVPAFHAAIFRHHNEDTVVINIGGIANITVLPSMPSDSIDGFDTGPGNCLLDEWIRSERDLPYDEKGEWAGSGNVSQPLLDRLMRDDFIQRPPAKSTGREYFNLAFFKDVLADFQPTKLAPEDIQATLVAFTVASITHGIKQSGLNLGRILVCGGGAKNATLMQGLRDSLAGFEVASTQALNIDPDAIEAIAFAWLARQRLELKPVRVTTNSDSRSRLLGAVYRASL